MFLFVDVLDDFFKMKHVRNRFWNQFCFWKWNCFYFRLRVWSNETKFFFFYFFNKKKYNSKSQSKCRLDRAIYWQQFKFYINNTTRIWLNWGKKRHSNGKVAWIFHATLLRREWRSSFQFLLVSRIHTFHTVKLHSHSHSPIRPVNQ